MKKIVCATRGGAAGRLVQEEAIALSKKHAAELIFLYVADSKACGTLPAELAAVVQDELTRIGRSLLHIAHVRAHERGVEAGMIAKCGPVRKTILEQVKETGADALVIGAPRSLAGEQVFGGRGDNSDAGIEAFAAEVTRRTGAEVLIV